MRAILWLDTHRPWPDLVDLAGQAEAAGWDGVRVADSDAPADCWVVGAALASTFPRLRIDVVVDDARGRHPAVIAKLASTLDLLSGGRLLLGVAPAADAGAPARLAECFVVLRALTERPRSTISGAFYHLDDAPLQPKPQQQPFPLMLVGGDADLAARVADHWSVLGGSAEVATRLDGLRDACHRVHRDPATIAVSAPYPAPAGVDEWVVPDALLGARGWARVANLERIASETATAPSRS
jgi:alkanesulfonate monooxygenase SsuD/methylene tetrahydromethanopterin reductase-like flavin-dependent oxidoreductase (luciferase family)